jgi:hypothetical protein
MQNISMWKRFYAHGKEVKPDVATIAMQNNCMRNSYITYGKARGCSHFRQCKVFACSYCIALLMVYRKLKPEVAATAMQNICMQMAAV